MEITKKVFERTASAKPDIAPNSMEIVQFPDEVKFAATCGDCYWNSGGWCKKHGGWVDADKWACGDYS